MNLKVDLIPSDNPKETDTGGIWMRKECVRGVVRWREWVVEEGPRELKKERELTMRESEEKRNKSENKKSGDGRGEGGSKSLKEVVLQRGEMDC